MDMVNRIMKMAEHIRVTIKMTRNMVGEDILGQMAKFTMEAGNKENNMEKPDSLTLKEKARSVFGKMANAKDG